MEGSENRQRQNGLAPVSSDATSPRKSFFVPVAERYVSLPPEAAPEWALGPRLNFPSRLTQRKASFAVDFITIVVVFLFGLLFSFLDPPNLRFRLDDPTISYPVSHSVIPTFLQAIFIIIGYVGILASYLWARDRIQLLHALLALTEALAFGYLTVSFLWWSVGGLRPSFLAVCDPDPARIKAAPYQGALVYYQWQEICRTPYSGPPFAEGTISFAMRQFPSGHAMFSMCPLVFVSLYWFTMLKPFDGFSHLWKLAVLAVLPMLGAWAAFTRITDFQHTSWAVVFGGLVGIFWALVMYRFHFKSWFDLDNHIAQHRMWHHLRSGQSLPVVDSGAPGSSKQDPLQSAIQAV